MPVTRRAVYAPGPGNRPGTASECGSRPGVPGTGENATVTRHPIFSNEHEELRASVRRYVDTEVRPHVDEWEDLGFFPDSVFRRAADPGFLGPNYPPPGVAPTVTWPRVSSSSRSWRG